MKIELFKVNFQQGSRIEGLRVVLDHFRGREIFPGQTIFVVKFRCLKLLVSTVIFWPKIIKNGDFVGLERPSCGRLPRVVFTRENEPSSKAIFYESRLVLKNLTIFKQASTRKSSRGRECLFSIDASCTSSFAPFCSEILQEVHFGGSNFVSSKFREMVWISRGFRVVVCQKWATGAHWLDLAHLSPVDKDLLPQEVTAPSLGQRSHFEMSFWHLKICQQAPRPCWREGRRLVQVGSKMAKNDLPRDYV